MYVCHSKFFWNSRHAVCSTTQCFPSRYTQASASPFRTCNNLVLHVRNHAHRVQSLLRLGSFAAKPKRSGGRCVPSRLARLPLLPPPSISTTPITTSIPRYSARPVVSPPAAHAACANPGGHSRVRPRRACANATLTGSGLSPRVCTSPRACEVLTNRSSRHPQVRKVPTVCARRCSNGVVRRIRTSRL